MANKYTKQKLKQLGLNVRNGQLSGFNLTGYEDDNVAILAATGHLMRESGMATLVPLLPAILSIKGEPYSLSNYFPFEPFFRTRMSRRTLLKAGRQVSKCLVKGSKYNKVYDLYGQRRRLSDIKVGDVVQSFDPEHFSVGPGEVVASYNNPRKECYYIRTRRGVEMELAGTHPLYTYNGWTSVDELDVGARIAHVRKGGKFGRKKICPRKLRVIAYMIGDGSFRGNYGFTANRTTQVAAEMRNLLKDFREYPKKGSKGTELRINRDHPLHVWAIEDNLDGKLSHEKQLPDWVFHVSKADTRTFIAKLWATDGMIKPGKSKATISYTSTSRDIVYDLKSLLTKFGIPTSVKERTGSYRKPDGRKVRCKQYWVLRVETREGWKTFMQEFSVPDKPGFDLPDSVSNNNRYTTPVEIRELIADLAGECVGVNRHGNIKSALHQYDLRRKPKYPVSEPKMARYLEFFRGHRADHPRLAEFEKYVNSDSDWDEIEEIRHIGEHECVDIEVADRHNYLLDGVVSHNSTSLASRGVVQCNCLPFFSILYVTPLFEMIRRFSNNYVRPFIELSPVKELFYGKGTMNSVLQRSFLNQSQMIFSFAYLDAERTRGVSCDLTSYDEIQDLDKDFIPIVRETMSGSKYGGIEQFAGTPKTMENTIEALWTDSSQAEWVIPCERGGCGHWNIPSLSHDLEAMTGPYRDDITQDNPGVVCAKCRKPIQPRNGRWVHRYKDRRWKFDGYHLPQHIFPMHYGNREKWQILLNKRAGKGNTQTHVYHNEVCGESSDSGSKIVTETDIKNACVLPWSNVLEEAKAQKGNYNHVILSADWGGGGEQRVSFTKFAVLGMRHDGKIDTIYGVKSLRPHDHLHEARLALLLAAHFSCVAIAHDYSGAGALRETFLVQAGYPKERIIPCSYVQAAAGLIMRHIPASQQRPREYWQIDKTRALQLICNQIKNGGLRFFKYDYVDSDDEGLLRDFLALVEEKSDTRTGVDNYTIVRDPARSDDFAQAVNVGCCTLYQMSGSWPDIASVAHLAIPAELEAAIRASNAPEVVAAMNR